MGDYFESRIAGPYHCDRSDLPDLLKPCLTTVLVVIHVLIDTPLKFLCLCCDKLQILENLSLGAHDAGLFVEFPSTGPNRLRVSVSRMVLELIEGSIDDAFCIRM